MANSFSLAQVIRALGLDVSGGNYKSIQNYIKVYGVDTSHFSGQLWNKGKTWENLQLRTPIGEILVEGSNFNTTHLKKRLFKEGIKQYACESCGLNEWMGKPIALQMHHINGVNTDNRLQNLQILCPNCHAQTNNYAGRNMGKSGEVA